MGSDNFNEVLVFVILLLSSDYSVYREDLTHVDI